MAPPETLDELIDRYGLGLTPADLLGEMDAALALLAAPAPPTGAEAAFLAEHAGPGAGAIVGGWDPARERDARALSAARSAEALLADTVTPGEAARILGVDRSRVSRRLKAGTLYSYTTPGGRHRVPRWQLAGGRLLPGVEAVVPAIPAAAGPLSVEALMRAPQPECGGLSPVEHLAAGGDPAVVAGLLASLDRW